MSRSRRKAIAVCSKKVDEHTHRATRRAVKVELAKVEPDLCIIDGDTKEVVGEDYGTKIDFEYINSDEFQNLNVNETQKKLRRK